MSLIDRVQAILLKPRLTWPTIAAERADIASIHTNYVMILAAIPAVAGFIGLTLIGIGGFGTRMRMPIMTGLLYKSAAYTAVVVVAAIIAGIALGFIASVLSSGPRIAIGSAGAERSTASAATTLLGNGVSVGALADRVKLAELRKAVAAVDIGRIEALKRPTT